MKLILIHLCVLLGFFLSSPAAFSSQTNETEAGHANCGISYGTPVLWNFDLGYHLNSLFIEAGLVTTLTDLGETSIQFKIGMYEKLSILLGRR